MSEEKFTNLFKQMIELGHEGRIGQVCKKFGVHRSTVDRWAMGIDVPLLAVRKQIEEYVVSIYAW